MILEFNCSKRHTLIDSKYRCQVFQEKISLTKANQLPRYDIDLNLSNDIEFLANMTGFSIEINKKIKTFEAQNENISQLRMLIKNKIFFRSPSHFYNLQQQFNNQLLLQVWQCKKTGQLVHVKQIPKIQVQKQIAFIQREIECQRILDHINIQKLNEMYQDKDYIYQVFELIDAPTLGEIANQLESFQIRNIMRVFILNRKQILQALEYIHSKLIIHRDVNPSNINIRNEHFILRDFGIATQLGLCKFSYTKCGTPGYLAPEVFDNIFTDKCDIFSAGCLFYKLLTKRELFIGKTRQEIVRLNKQCRIDFEILKIHKITKDEELLLQGLLELDHEKRLTATEALRQNYFSIPNNHQKKQGFQNHKRNQISASQSTTFEIQTQVLRREQQLERSYNLEEYKESYSSSFNYFDI